MFNNNLKLHNYLLVEESGEIEISKLSLLLIIENCAKLYNPQVFNSLINHSLRILVVT